MRREINKIATLACISMLVVGCILVIGCGSNNGKAGSNNEKVAGIYRSDDMNLMLGSYGSVILDMFEETDPNLLCEGRHGSFSYDGKEIKIKFLTDNNVMIFKVEGDNLVGISTGTEGQILKKEF